MNYCVYILFSAKLNRFYIGMTEDLEKRILFHNTPIDGAKYTAKGIPWVLYLFIHCQSKSHAIRLERLIKSKKSRVFIENLKKYPELVERISKESFDC